jgi:hypothetical protein
MPEIFTTSDASKSLGESMPSGRSHAGLKEEYFTRLFYLTGLLSIYKLCLDLAYSYISTLFGYQGLFYAGKTGLSEGISWIILFCSIPFIKRVFEERSLSGNILSLLLIFSFIPTLSAVSFRPDYGTSYVVLQMVYWFVLVVSWFFIKPVQFRGPKLLESRLFYVVTLFVLSGSVVIYSYLNTGLRFHFSLIDVYDIRAEAREFEAPFPLNYLVSLADNLIPFLAIYALHQKRYIIFTLAILIIYVNFSIAGTKQIIFVTVLGALGYFVIRDFSRSIRLVYAAIGLIILGTAESIFNSTNTLNTLFAYRVLFIPVELHYSYYSYFQLHEILYFNQSILKWFSGVERENIQFLLGEFSIGEFTARANNGLFSDAYMNLGVIGVLVFPPILALFLRVLDGSVIGLPQRILFVVTVYVGFVLLGMTFTSALLTSGLIFLVLLLYSLPRRST